MILGRLRRSVNVEVGAALNLVGVLLKYLSAAFIFPIPLALGYSEPWWYYAAAGAITALVGWGVERVTRGKERVGLREGFLVVSLTWLLGSAAIALSYVLSGEDQLSRPVDALFEAMSGMTTTGSSVVADVSTLDKSLAMWRQFTQWFGGMGIIVLALAVLPRLRVGGRQLMESEAPGPELEALTASIRDTARRLWLLYVALTGLLIAHPRRLRLDRGRPADEPLQRHRVCVLGNADRWFRHRPAVAGGVRTRLAMGARALHGHRGRELRASVPRVRAGQAGCARARRGVSSLPRPAPLRLCGSRSHSLGRRS